MGDRRQEPAGAAQLHLARCLADRSWRHRGRALLRQDRDRQARSGRRLRRASAGACRHRHPGRRGLEPGGAEPRLQSLPRRSARPWRHAAHRTVHGGRRALSGQDAAAGSLHRRQDGRGRRRARGREQAADRRTERDRGNSHAGASVPLGRRTRQPRRVLRRHLGQRQQHRDRPQPISIRSCSSSPSRISG